MKSDEWVESEGFHDPEGSFFCVSVDKHGRFWFAAECEEYFQITPNQMRAVYEWMHKVISKRKES